MTGAHLTGGLILSAIVLIGIAEAGQAAGPTASTASPQAPELPFPVDGPPSPVPPAVISRDGSGRATIRAVRITTPLRVDGQLVSPPHRRFPTTSPAISAST